MHRSSVSYNAPQLGVPHLMFSVSHNAPQLSVPHLMFSVSHNAPQLSVPHPMFLVFHDAPQLTFPQCTRAQCPTSNVLSVPQCTTAAWFRVFSALTEQLVISSHDVKKCHIYKKHCGKNEDIKCLQWTDNSVCALCVLSLSLVHSLSHTMHMHKCPHMQKWNKEENWDWFWYTIDIVCAHTQACLCHESAQRFLLTLQNGLIAPLS